MLRPITLCLALFSFACNTGLELEPGDTTKAQHGKADSSAEAVFLDFVFDGFVETDSIFMGPEGAINDQFLYTIGQLNGDRAVGRLDKLELSNVAVEDLEDGRKRISYRASLPVAWGDKNDIPDTYTFFLPRDISYSGQQAFTEKYMHDCVDSGAHDVDSGSMWYYYRPERSICNVDGTDVFEMQADTALSESNTTGKFPEYDMVWADNSLKVVAVFGKYEDDADSNSDSGIAAYNRFLQRAKERFQSHSLVTVPEAVPYNPGTELPEVSFRATMDDGRAVEIVAILVDNVGSAGADFDARYSELSGPADLIMYNGHAGLGANIRTLAQKGDWIADQYKIIFMNGCDTYAYVDAAIQEAHAALNPDDPTGTKYVDMVTNALPSFFYQMPRASMALINGLLDVEAPQTYEQIFGMVDPSQVILVSGEEDNTFLPGGGGTPTAWEGTSHSATIAQNAEVHFESPVLSAGRYVFRISGSNDADLYVRIGAAPTAQAYDCRPYKSGSNESCTVNLPSAGTIHFMVRGYANSSDFELSAGPEAI